MRSVKIKRHLLSQFAQSFSFDLGLFGRCFLALLFCLGLLWLEPAYAETLAQGEIAVKEGSDRTEPASSDSLVRMNFNQSMVGTLLGSADDEIVWSNEYFDGELHIRINRLRRLDTGKNVSLNSASPSLSILSKAIPLWETRGCTRIENHY